MTGPRAKTCATCGRVIAAHAVYYRFSLVLEGEQDLLDPSDDLEGNPAEALEALIRRLDEGSADPGEMEAQVHWERSGVICSECRAVAMRMLNTATADSEPH
ncbi:hypothetical protein [Corallococcus sp. EGB]|uniref:hypothetical protein n=1 Tax=Corallococcus sp. EGB TaxID=1521117 RepID=UPI001CC03B3F|nr:hypothetical protein [Corallococcus sp. EGB]